jgi:N-dimethylarginine dimethylaminohydrolase
MTTSATAMVLMGDPSYFHISGGANPFTRNFWGKKKQVDRDKAIRQWNELKNLLLSFGVQVFVIPPDPQNPGLVYPANAGVLLGETFVLSNLLPSRVGEKPIYDRFLNLLGLKSVSIQHRFEGEADFFPAGDKYIFTYGMLQRQRFVPRFGFPPWKRVYGFRSDRQALPELKRFLNPETEVVPFELVLETHYHGDTVFCAFGPRKEFLLVYLEALSPESQKRCRDVFKDRLIPLSRADAFVYAANSFQTKTSDGLKLILPEGASRALMKEIESRGVTPVTVDVSEFLKKGGGAVKCMLGDLGIRHVIHPAADKHGE